MFRPVRSIACLPVSYVFVCSCYGLDLSGFVKETLMLPQTAPTWYKRGGGGSEAAGSELNAHDHHPTLPGIR